MKLTRRKLFATIAAAFVAKPASEGVPLALMRAYDPQPMSATPAAEALIRCECPGCQYARGFIKPGGYDWYVDTVVPVIHES